MPKPTFSLPTLTISVPPSGHTRAILSPAASPNTPTRARRQHTAMLKAARTRQGAFLRVPAEADLCATADASTPETPALRRRTGRLSPRRRSPLGERPDHDSTAPSPVLGADDVLEIQEFLARKTWINEKIQLYESMPDVDVFAGARDLALAAQPGHPVRGLPDIEQYNVWSAEQTRIEKEMEFFNRGDLNRLKKFTRMKSQQNLSAEDTDLVDLTLSTLIGLEKLAALLRKRSDRLEALRLRLLWEDQRLAGWKDRQTLLSELESFVKRARWSPSTYDVEQDHEPETAALISSSERPSPQNSPTPAYERLRTVSNSSMTPSLSSSLVVPQSLLPSGYSDFSRSHRLQLSEGFSREAAAYASRVMNFKASRITVAANTLEKLIAVSREKVPDEILTEQDRLEMKSSALDGLGRFGMTIALQWTKADQSFGDMKVVQAMALQLEEEITKAKATHPTARMNEVIQTKLTALTTRLSGLGDPPSSRAFPRPLHPSYPDQHSSNQYILGSLALELSKAKDMVARTASSAEEYLTFHQAIRHIDQFIDDMRAAASRLTNATERLLNGTTSKEGDGTPVDIYSEACLDPMRHMLYLASVPGLTWELDEADEAAGRAITNCRGTLKDLQDAGVQVDGRLNIAVEAAVAQLESERLRSESILDDVSAKSGLLRDARELWVSIQDTQTALRQMRMDIAQAAESQRWQPMQSDGAISDEDDSGFTLVDRPIGASPLSTSTSADFHHKLDEVSSVVAGVLSPRHSQLLPALSDRLGQHISAGFDSLTSDITVLRETLRLLDDISQQAAIMSAVRRDATDLMDQIEELKTKVVSTRRAISNDRVLVEGGALIAKQALISDQFTRLKAQVAEFTQAVPSRVPLLNTRGKNQQTMARTSCSPSTLIAARGFSFALSELDDVIQADLAILTGNLNTGIESMTSQLTQIGIVGYVLWGVSLIIPQMLIPYLPFKMIILGVSGGVFSADSFLTALTSYMWSLRDMVFGDGGRKQLNAFQHNTRQQMTQLFQEVAAIRRESELEREERLRGQRDFKKKIEGILEQLRTNQAVTPGRISTARLDEIASSLANLTAFINDTDSVREEERALERMRQVALNMQRSVTFQTQNPFA